MRSKTSGISDRLRKRFKVITVIFIIILAFVAGKLLFIEIFNGDTYAQAALNRSRYSSTIPARRGDIYDRNNVLLASSTMEYNLILDPAILLTEGRNYLDITTRLLEKCFDIPASELREKALDNPESRYIILKKGLSYSQVKDFIEMSKAESGTIAEFLELPEDYKDKVEVAGAWLEDHYKRNYPYGQLACSVLGFTENGKGIYGIEKYYNEELSGTDGKKYTYLNNDNVVETVYRNSDDGYIFQLTIDYNIESIVEKYMAEMLVESGAQTIAVTIQDPNTGEFLAMADTNVFDPNNPRDLSVRYPYYDTDSWSDDFIAAKRIENWKNYCVSDTYEPGSTFKAFTVASALEEGSISEYQMFNCDGSVSMLDYIIHCANIAGHGEITLTEALSESCNMALMDIAKLEGVDLFSKYMAQYGFGSVTGIDLPNESSCSSLIHSRTEMDDLDLAIYSFGQGFNVTMVQMSSAFSSLINGGTYYKPHIVKGIYNQKGELVKSAGAIEVSKPVSEETCRFIKQALRHVITDGTGPSAAVPGYITAGKTGTAQKGSRDDDFWVASFIGFAPYDDPQLVCYVIIDEPESGGDGSSEYACRLFSQIMSEVLPYINAVPASMDYDPTGVGSPENGTVNTVQEEVYYEETYDYENTDVYEEPYYDNDYSYEETYSYDEVYYEDAYYEDAYYEDTYYDDTDGYYSEDYYDDGYYSDEWY